MVNAMTFNEILQVLRNSEIDDRVKFTHGDMAGYFVKSLYGEFVYHFDGRTSEYVNFFLSDFDREDWEIIP
jgi:hypothetical protein